MARILKELEASFIDYPNNSDISVCVVMMGCTNGCKGCQNPQFMNPLYEVGTIEVTSDTLLDMIKDSCKRNGTNKVVFSGGDPLSEYNINFTKEILGKLEGYDVCIFTGHDIEYVQKNGVNGFKFVKCGKYMPELSQKSYKDDEIFCFASKNQVLYDGNYKPLSKDGIYKFN